MHHKFFFIVLLLKVISFHFISVRVQFGAFYFFYGTYELVCYGCMWEKQEIGMFEEGVGRSSLVGLLVLVFQSNNVYYDVPLTLFRGDGY